MGARKPSLMNWSSRRVLTVSMSSPSAANSVPGSCLAIQRLFDHDKPMSRSRQRFQDCQGGVGGEGASAAARPLSGLGLGRRACRGGGRELGGCPARSHELACRRGSAGNAHAQKTNADSGARELDLGFPRASTTELTFPCGAFSLAWHTPCPPVLSTREATAAPATLDRACSACIQL